jgi:cytochrome P450
MLTWTMHLLATHPAALAEAVAEVDRVLGAQPPGSTASAAAAAAAAPPFAAFKELVFLECCMKEAMRLYSPVPVLARESCADDVLGGVRIPSGTAIMVSIWAMHTSREIWGEDVAEFRPARFLPGSKEAAGRHPYAFMPFSLGPRVCIGQHLAMSEAKVVLGSLLRAFSVAAPPGAERRPETDRYIIPVRPAKPLYVLLTPRAAVGKAGKEDGSWSTAGAR